MSDHTPEEPTTPFNESKPTETTSILSKLGKYWPDWLPRSHGRFAILLMIFVLFGWATDTKGPQEKDYGYSDPKPPTRPTEPVNPNENEAPDPRGEIEPGSNPSEEKSDEQKKYDEELKEYQEKKKKYDEEYKEYEEDQKEVNEKNKEGAAQYKEDRASWDAEGLSGMTGEAFAKWRIDNGQFMAGLVVMIWLTYCVFTMLLGPTLKAVPVHFGKDFGVVITPLVLLGILVALGAIIGETVKSTISGDQSIAGALQQFVMLIVNPITTGIKNLNSFVFDKWHIPIIFITITATFGLQRIWGSKSKEE